jgi:hypothetical protein
MILSEIADSNLRLSARRAYELGRLEGALWRGTLVALFALPGFLVCNGTPIAALCLGGLALVVVAGRVRGEAWADGARAGAIAGLAPCLLPAAMRAINPDLCAALMTGVPWPCAVGGIAAGAILALRGRAAGGLPFWASAIAALGFAAALGCLPAGVMGFAGLLLGVIAGGAPVLVARRALG